MAFGRPTRPLVRPMMGGRGGDPSYGGAPPSLGPAPGMGPMAPPPDMMNQGPVGPISGPRPSYGQAPSSIGPSPEVIRNLIAMQSGMQGPRNVLPPQMAGQVGQQVGQMMNPMMGQNRPTMNRPPITAGALGRPGIGPRMPPRPQYQPQRPMIAPPTPQY